MIAPLLMLGIFLPMIEMGRAMMGSELACNAARAGCRAGVIPSATNATITTRVNDLLAAQLISGATTTILINGGPGDVATAMQGDIISVQVSIPYERLQWMGTTFFMGGQTISSTQLMRRE